MLTQRRHKGSVECFVDDEGGVESTGKNKRLKEFFKLSGLKVEEIRHDLEPCATGWTAMQEGALMEPFRFRRSGHRRLGVVAFCAAIGVADAVVDPNATGDVVPDDTVGLVVMRAERKLPNLHLMTASIAIRH